MTLSAANIVHQNSGGTSTSSTSTPITVALAGAETTDAESSVVLISMWGGAAVTFPTPAGWSRTQLGNGITRLWRTVALGLAAGESSWNFTPNVTGGGPVMWVVLDLTNTNAVTLFDVSVQSTVTSGTTGQLLSGTTSTYDGMALCVHAVIDTGSTTPTTWSGHSDSFEEVIEASQAGGSTAVSMSVSVRPVQTLGSFGASATADRTLSGTNSAALHTVVIRAAGARLAPNLYFLDGAEHGTVTGNTLVAGHLLTAASAGVSVSAAAARSGNYGWLLSATSAACNFTTTYNGAIGTISNWIVLRRCFRFPTLPAVDTEIWALTTATTSVVATLRFIAATGKLGMKVGTGAEQVSDQAVTADQWFAVDLIYYFGTTAYYVDWTVDYDAELTDPDVGVAQTRATHTAGGISNAGLSAYRVGWTAAITATLHTDDAAGTFLDLAQYPLPDIRVLPLLVDPAGTPTISGASTNFGVMTGSWGTVAAWNAANARNAVDEVPANMTDAAVAVTAHATDYAEFPMETYDLAANKVNVRGVRAIAAITAASGTAATIRAEATDGTTTYPVYSEADPGADAATPVWLAKTLRPASGRTDWTQGRVNGLAFRFGSNDATPDIGPTSIVFELAVVKAVPETLFGEAGEPIYVEAHRDPDSLALVGATVNTDADNTVELTWEVDGVPDTSGSIPPSSSTYVPLSADGSIETVGTVSLIPG